MPPPLCLIAAVARNRAIGLDNQLLWRLPEDLQHFKRSTLGCPIIMGRKTWDSIGRPLPGRRNIVLSRNPQWQAAGAEVVPSLEAALLLARNTPDARRLFVVGGAQLYTAALPLADELLLTEVDDAPAADCFFPEWDRTQFEETSRVDGQPPEGAPGYQFVAYRRRSPARTTG